MIAPLVEQFPDLPGDEVAVYPVLTDPAADAAPPVIDDIPDAPVETENDRLRARIVSWRQSCAKRGSPKRRSRS